MNTKPNLKAIIDNNLDKTGHIPSKGQSRLPKEGWLDSYKHGGPYASSWMLTNPKPAPVSFPRMQFAGPVSSQDSLRHQAGKMFNFEETKGSPTGTKLDDWGYHQSQMPWNTTPKNWKKPETPKQAVDLYMQEIATNPILGYFPSAMEKGEAGDFLYNSGRDARVYMLDQYLKSKGEAGLPNRGSYNVDTKTEKWTPELQQSLNEQWNNYSQEINKLPTNTRRQLLNKGRDFYYKNTYSADTPGVTYWSRSQEQKPGSVYDNQTGYWYHRGTDGSLSPAYDKTWKPRIWESVNTYENGGEEKYKRSISDNTRVAPRQIKGESDAELMDYFLKYKKPYEPSQSVKNIKAGLSAADLATVPFVGNPIGAVINRGLGALNSVADATTSLRYAMDGQWTNAGIDAGEALLDLVRFRKGKPNPNVYGKGELKLSKLDKSLNKGLLFAKGAAYADDFQDVFPRKENGGDISIPDLDANKWLMKYQDRGEVLLPKIGSKEYYQAADSKRITSDNTRAVPAQITGTRESVAEERKKELAERARKRKDPGTFSKGNYAIEESLRAFPESQGGIGELIDEYANPAYFIGRMASNLGNAGSKAYNTGDFSSLPGAIAEPLVAGALGLDPLGSAIKVPGRVAQSMESGLLSNTYKLNPWAFKANPEAYYRKIGDEGLNDALESGLIRAKQQPKNVSTGEYDMSYFKNYQHKDPYFAKGKPLETYKGKYMAEVEKIPMEERAGYPSIVYVPKDILKTSNPNLKLYEKNWLKGYKEVPKSVPAKKKGGMITDPRGQWAHPGQNTRIPSNNITMDGVGYPVLAKASNGQQQMMYPGQNYYFPGASHVDEYPMMESGGWLNKHL